MERCWELAYPVTFNILRDRRIGLVALAAADAAVWDAVGKALDEPLWRLWGGYRDTVELIVIGGYYDSEQSITDEITAYREMGLAGCKFKVGGDTPERDAARVHEARDGCRRRLRADDRRQPGLRRARRRSTCAGGWRGLASAGSRSRAGGTTTAATCAMCGRSAGFPVCAGQTELSVSGCRDLMEAGAIDVCNFDSSWSGGPTAWRRCAAVAHAYDVAMGHHEEPQVALHLIGKPVARHLCRVLPSPPRPVLVEHDRKSPRPGRRVCKASHGARARMAARPRLHRIPPDRPMREGTHG